MSLDGRWSRQACVIRHVAFEDLGTFGPVLSAAGFDLSIMDAGVDDLFEPIVRSDLVVVLGGPIGVYEQDRYPFLNDELRALGQRLREGLPTLGICLGAQLMAAALGARVQACVRPERILLHPSSDYPRPNAIPATVARTIYYGDHQRLMCDLGHGQEQATVKLPLAPAGAPCSHPQPGDQVLLEFPPAATRIYTV